MIRVNRTFLFVYDLLIGLAFLLRFVMVGPILFDQVWCFWTVFVMVAVGLILLNYLTFCHPTPLEIVAYHVNLIMRHPTDQDDNEAYDDQNKLYLTERLIQSTQYQFFYYDDCCAKTNQYHRMKIKLAIGDGTFNQTSIIIKTMDQQFIRFNMIKETEYSLLSFLYEWEIDEIEYSDQATFDRMARGI